MNDFWNFYRFWIADSFFGSFNHKTVEQSDHTFKVCLQKAGKVMVPSILEALVPLNFPWWPCAQVPQIYDFAFTIYCLKCYNSKYYHILLIKITLTEQILRRNA